MSHGKLELLILAQFNMRYMTLKHISNNKSILCLKQCKSLELHFLEIFIFSTTTLVITSVWHVALIWPSWLSVFSHSFRRPDMTFTVDWALRTNYLSCALFHLKLKLFECTFCWGQVLCYTLLSELIGPPTAPGHLRAFHKFKSYTCHIKKSI